VNYRVTILRLETGTEVLMRSYGVAIVAQACNPSTWEGRAEGPQVKARMDYKEQIKKWSSKV
jgi:hypothetical protein